MMLLTASVCLLFIGCAKDEIFPNDLTSKAKQVQKLPDDGEIFEKAVPASGCNCEYRITGFTDNNTNPLINHSWKARVYNIGNPNTTTTDNIYSGLQGNKMEDWFTYDFGTFGDTYPTIFQPFKPSPNADPNDIQSENLWLQYNGDVADDMTMMIHIRCSTGNGSQVGNQYFTITEPENVAGPTWWNRSFCVSCRDIQEGECPTGTPGPM